MQQMTQEELEQLMTFKETMKYLRVARATLWRMMTRGEVTGHKIGGTWRFYPSELDSAIRGEKPESAEQGEE